MSLLAILSPCNSTRASNLRLMNLLSGWFFINIIAIAVCPITIFIALFTGKSRYYKQAYNNLFHARKSLVKLFRRAFFINSNSAGTCLFPLLNLSIRRFCIPKISVSISPIAFSIRLFAGHREQYQQEYKNLFHNWLMAFFGYCDSARATRFQLINFVSRWSMIIIIVSGRSYPHAITTVLRTANNGSYQQNNKGFFHINKIQTITDKYKYSIKY